MTEKVIGFIKAGDFSKRSDGAETVVAMREIAAAVRAAHKLGAAIRVELIAPNERQHIDDWPIEIRILATPVAETLNNG